MINFLKKIWNWILSLFQKKVLPVTNVVITSLNKRSKCMENLKISWALSPSTIVEKQQVFVSVDGAAAQVGADLPSNISELAVAYQAGVVIQAFVRVIGDNGTQADSILSEPYTVKDLQTIVAAGKPSIAWLSHTD
jgi:hypothetical protein